MHAAALIRSVGAELCRPWPRHILPQSDWAALVRALADDPLVLLAFWADTMHIHTMFLDETALAVLPVSFAVESGRYAALSPSRPEAAWYERMVQDLWGHVPEGGIDPRPWLDHGHWPLSRPMSSHPAAPENPAERPEFRLAAVTSVMQMPIGPVWGQVEEAAHLRLATDGRHVVQAESLLGYAHKGTLALMRGKSPRAAARFAARLSGDATVAHATAFAHAAEAALDVTVPDRALVLRAAMAEVERIAGHLGTLAEQAAVTGAVMIETICGAQREALLRATDAAFGHRLMMDCIVPGGIAGDIEPGGRHALLRAAGGIATELPVLRDLHAGTSHAARLSGAGQVNHGWAARFGVGGVTGRASGRAFDARSLSSLYHEAKFQPMVGNHGDATARTALRLREIEESLRLLSLFLERLPEGDVAIALPMNSGEGIGSAESVRGDVWHWLRLDHGQIASVFPRDPGWGMWPLFEVVLRGAAVEDLQLIRSSLALPASGVDL